MRKKKLLSKLLHYEQGTRKISPQKISPQKIAPYENIPVWICPPMKASACKNYPPPPRENCLLWKFPTGKITPNEIPSPLTNHTNEKENKITNFFALKKAVQYNILTYWA